jgi:hypothetical protein
MLAVNENYYLHVLIDGSHPDKQCGTGQARLDLAIDRGNFWGKCRRSPTFAKVAVR